MFPRPKNPPADRPGQETPGEATGAATAGAANDRATYDVPDFAVLTDDDVVELLQRARRDAADGQPSCIHLVVTRDRKTGVVNHHVPCTTGLEALALASQVVVDSRAADPAREFTVTVMPLLPH